MRIRIAVVSISLVLVAGLALAAEEGDEARARSIERTGIPAMCAERFSENGSAERCVEHQFAAGRRIRKLLLANRDDGELEATTAACAARAQAGEGAYDWVSLEDCIRAWIRGARRGDGKGPFKPGSAG